MKLDWKDVLERSIATMCETALAMIPISAMVHEVDWIAVLATSATAGILAVLKAVAKAWGHDGE